MTGPASRRTSSGTSCPPAAGPPRRWAVSTTSWTWYQEGEWNWERRALQHVNPYTGLAYKDDPALAIIEVADEDNLFWHTPLSDGFCNGSDYPVHHRLLVYMWYKWLQNKYGTDANLAAAWGAGLRSGDSVESFNPDMKIYAAWEMSAAQPFSGAKDKARCGDWIRFLAEQQRAHYQTRIDNVRSLGYQGLQLTVAWQAGGASAEAANVWTDSVGDIIDRHVYLGGASSFYVKAENIGNQSQIADPSGGVLAATRVDTGSGGPYETVWQVEGKPAISTEWDEVVPDQWRAEMAPLYAFYEMGLHDTSGSLNFQSSYPWMETGWPGPVFGPSSWCADTPVYIGQFPALAMAVYRGYIAPGADVADRRMSVDDLFRGIDPLSQDLPDGGYPGSQNMFTPSEVNAIGRVTFKADDALQLVGLQKVDWTPYWDQDEQGPHEHDRPTHLELQQQRRAGQGAEGPGRHRLVGRQGQLQSGQRDDERQLRHAFLQPAVHLAGRPAAGHLRAHPGDGACPGHPAGHGLRRRGRHVEFFRPPHLRGRVRRFCCSRYRRRSLWGETPSSR